MQPDQNTKDTIVAMWRKGCTAQQIADELNVGKSLVQRLRPLSCRVRQRNERAERLFGTAQGLL